LSLAVGAVQLTVAAQVPGEAETEIGAGSPESDGGCVSTTVTVKLAVCEFPAGSVAVYVMVVVPTGKLEPGAKFGEKLAIEQLSLAVGAVQLAVCAQVPGAAFTEMFAGVPVIAGGCVSETVTVKLAIAVFPAPSVAV
jgi:hypothetical protein